MVLEIKLFEELDLNSVVLFRPQTHTSLIFVCVLSSIQSTLVRTQGLYSSFSLPCPPGIRAIHPGIV